MTKILVAAAPLTLLAACSGGSSDEMQPGEWEMTMQMNEIDAPDMPEELRTMMQQQMGQPETSTDCVDEEAAANPMQSMFADGELGENCDFGDSNIEGGVIDVSGSCESQGAPGPAEMSLQGSYTATTITADVQMTMDGGPMGEIRMAGTMNGERTGDCDA